MWSREGSRQEKQSPLLWGALDWTTELEYFQKCACRNVELFGERD